MQFSPQIAQGMAEVSNWDGFDKPKKNEIRFNIQGMIFKPCRGVKCIETAQHLKLNILFY